jgi:hypothetical protein
VRTFKKKKAAALGHSATSSILRILYSPKCVEYEFSEVHIQDPAYPTPGTHEIASLDTPLRYAPLELVTLMDRYAR